LDHVVDVVVVVVAAAAVVVVLAMAKATVDRMRLLNMSHYRCLYHCLRLKIEDGKRKEDVVSQTTWSLVHRFVIVVVVAAAAEIAAEVAAAAAADHSYKRLLMRAVVAATDQR